MITSFQILDNDVIKKVISEARTILGTWGVWVEHEEAVTVLLDNGASEREKRIRIPDTLIDRALSTVPDSFSLWDLSGENEYIIGKTASHFVPGSAALEIWDPETHTPRNANTVDLVNLARVVDSLPHLALQSTSLISSDVPEPVADRYRLFVILQFCRKPIVTGTFQEDAFEVMQSFLEIVRGSSEQLHDKPLAIFDCCPSAPLNWSRLTTDALIRAARAGIPAELISMPLSGATGPATLLGSVVQHCAENLAGIVIHQLVSPGSPIVYGGSPSIMDMRHGTTPMGAIETQMIDVANAQIGKTLGVPTHAYMGLSDAPWPDYQGGSESTLGATLAILGGINVISGPGMLKFESRQSLEKLVMDNDVVGAVKRLKAGIEEHECPIATHLMDSLLKQGHLLEHNHTRSWFRSEFYFPGHSFERRADPGLESDASGAHVRARKTVEKILAKPAETYLDAAVVAELRTKMSAELKRYGAELPRGIS